MSNYKTHTKFNLLLALPLLIAFFYYFLHTPVFYIGIFSSCFAYSSLFMNPDVDLAHQIKLFSLRGFLTLPFRFYSRIFHHRGLSHNVFLGSVTRILWLSLFLFLVLYLIDLPLDKKNSCYFCVKYQKELLFGFMGIVSADICHLLLD